MPKNKAAQLPRRLQRERGGGSAWRRRQVDGKPGGARAAFAASSRGRAALEVQGAGGAVRASNWCGIDGARGVAPRRWRGLSVQPRAAADKAGPRQRACRESTQSKSCGAAARGWLRAGWGLRTAAGWGAAEPDEGL